MVGNRGFQDARTGKCVPLARQESQMDAHRGFERPRTSKSVPLALRVSQMVGNRGFERPRTSKPVPLALWGSHSGPPVWSLLLERAVSAYGALEDPHESLSARSIRGSGAIQMPATRK
jgi:hypothetical protein